jgi:aromatic ring-opening dioxygenase LigB subunit
MQAMEKADFSKTFELLQRYCPLPESEINDLEAQTSSQLQRVASRFGEIIGFEFIRNKQIKNFALQKIYVLKFERHIIRVLFTYYRNEQGWMLNAFSWDDRFYELFE